MAALALAPDAAREFLAELGSPAEIAALNATHSVTISGPARRSSGWKPKRNAAASGFARSISISPFIRGNGPDPQGSACGS